MKPHYKLRIRYWNGMALWWVTTGYLSTGTFSTSGAAVMAAAKNAWLRGDG